MRVMRAYVLRPAVIHDLRIAGWEPVAISSDHITTQIRGHAMATIPENYLDLLTQKKAFATIATTMPDGSPQVTPVWFDYKDGLCG